MSSRYWFQSSVSVNSRFVHGTLLKLVALYSDLPPRGRRFRVIVASSA